MMIDDLMKLAYKNSERLNEIWEDFHRHPEVGFEEEYTSGKICGILESLNIDVQRMGKTGVVGLIHGTYPGRTILLRADIDALPITEATNLACASRNPGRMHACGHDAHTTWLLGTAMLLSEMKDKIHGTVKLMFQPGEEVPGGAASMLDRGVLSNPDVDFALAAHVSPEYDAGSYVIQSGPVTAFPDFFTLKLFGKGAHGAQPHNSIDSINMGVKVYELLQSFASRINSPYQPFVLSVCMFEGGTAPAAIPGECRLRGTVRCFDDKVQSEAKQFIEKCAKAVTELYGGRYELDYAMSCFPTVNDEKLTEKVRKNTKELLGGEAVLDPKERFMGGEDFCFFAREVPSVYMFAGCRNDELFQAAPLHNPLFRLDRSVLWRTSAVMCYNTIKLLEE